MLSDDDWRRAHQVYRALNEVDVKELFGTNVVFLDDRVIFANELVLEEGLLWEVTHCGVSVTFNKGDLFTEGDRIFIEGNDGEEGIFVLYINHHPDT